MAAITGAALAALLQTCAPNVAPATMHAIVSVESGGNPWAIGDNTAHRSYAPRSYAEALAISRDLIARGHNIDLGIAQVNSANFSSYHLTPSSALIPCQNLIVGSVILTNAYRWSLATYGNQPRALWGSISAYNSGSLTAGGRYVNLVVSAARQTPLVPPIDILTGYARPEGPTGISSVSHAPPVPNVIVRPIPLPAFGFAHANGTNLAIKAPTAP